MKRVFCSRDSRTRRGFTLLEVVTVIVVISALITLVAPVTQMVLARSRAAHCLNNLRGLGAALQLYASDNNNMMPTLVTARESTGDDQPAIDNTLLKYTNTADAFHCIADNKGLWQTTGCSYFWNSLVNGQNLAAMNFMGITTDDTRIPVISDKENFHLYQKIQVNILYADGHAAKEIQFVTGGSQ